MKRFFLISGALLMVLVIALFTIPFLIPKEVYKTRIEAAASEALGRDVRLNGDVSLSIFPRISASVGDVTVLNPGGFSAENMIEAGQLRGSVKWAPLISRRVDIQEIAFVDATVNLQRRADGATNWELASDKAPTDNDGQSSDGAFDAGIASARLEKANLTYIDDVAGTRYDLEDFNLLASLQALDEPLEATADGVFQDQAFEIELTLDSPEDVQKGLPAKLLASLKTDLADMDLNGQFTLGDTPELDLNAVVSAPNVQSLAQFAKLETPINLAPLGSVNLTAKITGPIGNLAIAFDQLSLKGNQLNADFSGNVLVGDTLSIDGRLKAQTPQAGDLSAALGIDLPAADALEAVDISGRISGRPDALNLTQVSAKHSGALLNANYTGDISLAGDGKLSGKVTASSDELRALLKTADVELAENNTLNNFSADTGINGSFKKLSFSDLSLKLDDVAAKGNAGIDLSGPRARISGTLDMGELNLTPFLGEPKQKSNQTQAQGWSETPLDLSSLKSVDADLNITTTRLLIGNIDLTNAALKAQLSDGRLNLDLPEFQGFGGAWKGAMVLDTRNQVPTLSMDMTGNRVAMSGLLGTLAGFDKLAGTGGFTLTASSEGVSIADIMKGLDAELGVDLKDGALKGINIAQLVRSADTLQNAIKGGDLANLDLSGVMSPSAETDFTNFTAALTVKDGLATVDILKLLNPVLGVDGTGKINLGNQTLDLRLATSIDKKGTGSGSVVQLNGIPVPVRLSGKWSDPKISPDLSGIESALRKSLEGQIKDEISDRIGGQLGNGASGILGNVLGLPESDEEADPQAPSVEEEQAPDTDAVAETPTDPRDAIEEAAEKAARDALGGILGRTKKKEAEDTAPAPDE